MDLFSKFCLLIPVRKISTPQVCTILAQCWFRRYSTPKNIITDNASTFLAKEFQGFLEKYKIKHWANARHHSQANPVERLNRTINACIRTYVRRDQTLWDTRVSEIEYVLNNTPHTATGFTPYKVLFGHEIISTGEEHLEEQEDISDGERVMKKQEIDTFIRELVYKNLKKQCEKITHTYNLRFKNPAPTYVVGQKVLKRNFRQSSAIDKYNAKLGPTYIPCIIQSRVGTSSYELVDEFGKSLGVFFAADLNCNCNLLVHTLAEHFLPICIYMLGVRPTKPNRYPGDIACLITSFLAILFCPHGLFAIDPFSFVT